MKKLKQTIVNDVTEFVSITDLTTRDGRAQNTSDAMASMALDNIPGFPVLKDISDENIKSMKDGYSIAYSEIFKPNTYAVINGHYIKSSPSEHDGAEKIELSLSYCLSFTPNEMTSEFKDRPDLKKLVGDVRSSHSKYVSQRMNRLASKGAEILKKRSGETTTRSIVLFEDAVKKAFDHFEKSAKIKSERNKDETANPIKFKIAVEAFWKAYHS